LIKGEAAFVDTLTVTVTGGYVPPTAKESAREQVKVARIHPHPGPLIAVAVIPAGKMSVTVTAPLVAAVPAFRTDRVYAAAGCP